MNRKDCEIIRSRRSTVGLRILSDGKLIVRVPMNWDEKELPAILEKYDGWIRKTRELQALNSKKALEDGCFTEEDLENFRKQAEEVLPARVAYFAGLLGVDYRSVVFRLYKSRWGCCTNEGELRFNYLIMAAPPEAVDYVAAHEVCHRKEMNHGKEFYRYLEQIYPDYREPEEWMKKNGVDLMKRAKLC